MGLVLPYNCRTLSDMAGMTAERKTRRFEARLDAETDDLISQAAALVGQSRSAFVVDAAREAADRTLARADVTLMPAEQFDAMMASLDVPDDAPRLQKLLAGPRKFRRA